MKPLAAMFAGGPNRWLRLTRVRIISQIVFFVLFVLAVWATWTSRLGGFPVSGLLELDPLVMLSTVLATGYVYKFLGWGLIVVAITFLFGRVFCNWICPYGTLHQLVGWLFDNRPGPQRIDQNRYHRTQYIKYSILIVFLVMSAMGALQIGLLDPIVMMYRAMTTFFSPLTDTAVGHLAGAVEDMGGGAMFLDSLKFAPGVESRIFVGSFWIGAIFLFFVLMNLWKPRFFCRFVCPLGALLGVIASKSVFRINRIVDKCTDCDLCLLRCEGASDPQSLVRQAECFSCMNCIDDCPEDALEFTMFRQDKKQVLPFPDMSRRQLVFAGALGLVAAPALRNNGLVNDENFSAKMIRPPGSVEEAEFLERCIKCDQCINACPTNVLQPATLAEGGIEAVWTPVMNFHIAHCQLKCNLCSEVCPTGAIRRISVAEKLGEGPYAEQGPVRLGTAFIDTTRCLPWANQVPCVVCEEVCPVAPKAIQTHDEETRDVFGQMVVLNKPFIVPDLCIGCGICEAECPVQDQPAVYVTAVGESRSKNRRLLLRSRTPERPI
ncbi:MAG: 4Fe-4S dicluster domain-containing protein [Gammaproteobacteria bacterium]|nr:4Fe-4S dicluster domain-containing protein [Gammaproteobacteria bacterium]